MDLAGEWNACERELAGLSARLTACRSEAAAAWSRAELARQEAAYCESMAARSGADREERVCAARARSEWMAAESRLSRAREQLRQAEEELRALERRYEGLQRAAEGELSALRTAAERLRGLSGNRYARLGPALEKLRAAWDRSQRIAQGCAVRRQQLRDAQRTESG